jgi:hypothetical protein
MMRDASSQTEPFFMLKVGYLSPDPSRTIIHAIIGEGLTAEVAYA